MCFSFSVLKGCVGTQATISDLSKRFLDWSQTSIHLSGFCKQVTPHLVNTGHQLNLILSYLHKGNRAQSIQQGAKLILIYLIYPAT